jgi:hypothetical protein
MCEQASEPSTSKKSPLKGTLPPVRLWVVNFRPRLTGGVSTLSNAKVRTVSCFELRTSVIRPVLNSNGSFHEQEKVSPVNAPLQMLRPGPFPPPIKTVSVNSPFPLSQAGSVESGGAEVVVGSSRLRCTALGWGVQSAESVNRFLRSAMKAMPERTRKRRSGKHPFAADASHSIGIASASPLPVVAPLRRRSSSDR